MLLGFFQLLDGLVHWLHTQSMLRIPGITNEKAFCTTPPLNRAIHEEAFKIVLKNPFQEIELLDKNGQNVTLYISAAPHMQVLISEESAASIAQKWVHSSWETFDEYAATVKNARVLYLDEDSEANWKGIVCVCCDFQKSFLCSDAVALAHLKQLYQIPSEHQVLYNTRFY